MTKVAILVLTLAAFFAVPPSAAHHCQGPTEAEAIAHGSYYIVTDKLGGVFVYEESNGKKGLQRGDFLMDNTCHGRVLSDERVF